MSLVIALDKVASVLLADGTWYDVAATSFTLDSYEFVHGEETVHKGGASGVAATGFSFKVGGRGGAIKGPLTAILAVRTN